MNNPQKSPEDKIDDALNSYILEPLPPDFVNQVMSRVNAAATSPAPIHFRLDILDVAIPYFAASFMAIVLFMLQHWESLGGTSWAEPAAFSNALDNFEAGTLIFIGLIVIVEMFIAGAVIVWLWTDRPGRGIGLPT